MKLKPYPKYKDSGIKWIGKIPEGWRIRKIKYTSTITMGQSPNAALINNEAKGIPFFQGKADFCELYPEPKSWIEQHIKIARRNDILITVRAPVGALNISNQTCCIGRGLAAIRFHNYKYLYYNLHIVEEPLNAISSGSTFEAIAFDDLKSMIIPLSENVEQQTTIASFLDKKTAKIDTLIEKDKKLIELLKEKRTALINHVVTKGLDPNVKLKDSGIPWIGKIPEHWELKRLKYVASLKSGSGITSNEIKESGEYPVFGGNGLRGYFSSYTHDGKYVLIGRQGALCGNINYASGKFWASEHAVVATLLSDYKLFWFGELLRTMNLNQYSQSAAQPGLAVDNINNLDIPVPSNKEQTLISIYLDRHITLIDKTIKKIEKNIELLEEYKKSLIHYVVTGKVDVRKSEV